MSWKEKEACICVKMHTTAKAKTILSLRIWIDESGPWQKWLFVDTNTTVANGRPGKGLKKRSYCIVVPTYLITSPYTSTDSSERWPKLVCCSRSRKHAVLLSFRHAFWDWTAGAEYIFLLFYFCCFCNLQQIWASFMWSFSSCGKCVVRCVLVEVSQN